jgi:hypothetical protein
MPSAQRGALFAACVVIQIFLAGLDVFADPRSFITHREFGYVFGFLTLALLVLALVGREPRRVTGLSALLLLLFALQSVFVALRASIPEIAALHPLNGFFILFVAITVSRASWAVRDEATDVSTVASMVSTPGEAH